MSEKMGMMNTGGSAVRIFFWCLFALLILAFLSMTFGSYSELEQRAGNIFAIITAVLLVLGVALFIWQRKASKA